MSVRVPCAQAIVGEWMEENKGNCFMLAGSGGEAELAKAGIDKDAFFDWVEQCENAIRNEDTTVSSLCKVWEVDDAAAVPAAQQPPGWVTTGGQPPMMMVPPTQMQQTVT